MMAAGRGGAPMPPMSATSESALGRTMPVRQRKYVGFDNHPSRSAVALASVAAGTSYPCCRLIGAGPVAWRLHKRPNTLRKIKHGGDGGARRGDPGGRARSGGRHY